MNKPDTSTRLYDKSNLTNLDGWIKHQYEETRAGKPRNAEKLKEAADELLARAEEIYDLEKAVRKGKADIKMPERLAPAPVVQKARQTHQKLPAVPSMAQFHTMIQREVKNAVKSAVLELKG